MAVATRHPRRAALEATGGQKSAPAVRAVWVFSARSDLLIALCWVPLFLVGLRVASAHGPAADETLRRMVGAAFLLSFLHQPLTLGLVYGDANRFRERRRLFTWSPLVALAVVGAAVALHLWVIIPVAAVWNTVHTLQQRYGLSRIYARKSGYGSPLLDRWVLYAFMVSALLVVAANPGTLRLVDRVELDPTNAGAVRRLVEARPFALMALVVFGTAAAALLVALIRQEMRQASGASAPANPAKWLYQGSSLALIVAIALNPAAGFIAYVGAHAIEYFVVVYKTAESRYGAKSDPTTLLGRAAYRPAGRAACFAAVAAAAFLVYSRTHGQAFDVVLYTVGILHFWYDGFIWKLRKPAIAADFSIAPGTRSV
jgi:hypothetical protein